MKPQPLRVKLREATWTAILDAAENVAASSGSSNASLQSIAEHAGIAVGTIYNYFEDKDELFAALFKRRREELFEAIDDAAKKYARHPFAAQLESFVLGVFAYFDTRRAFLRIALQVDPSRPLAAKGKDAGKLTAMRHLQERAEQIVRLGVREKRLREDNAPLLGTVLVAIVRGVLIMQAEGDKSLSAETGLVVSLFLDGAAK